MTVRIMKIDRETAINLCLVPRKLVRAMFPNDYKGTQASNPMHTQSPSCTLQVTPQFGSKSIQTVAAPNFANNFYSSSTDTLYEKFLFFLGM
jgi:hypothetical protein